MNLRIWVMVAMYQDGKHRRNRFYGIKIKVLVLDIINLRCLLDTHGYKTGPVNSCINEFKINLEFLRVDS